MKFRVTYVAWGKTIAEIVEGATEAAVRAEVNRTLFGPDARIISIESLPS